MSNLFWKNFSLCFTKFKCPSLPLPPPPPSQQQDHTLPPPTTTTTTTPSTLIKNFNYLFDPTPSDHSTSKSLTTTSSSSHFFSTSSDDNSDTDSPPPDFASIFASQRFFFSSPGRSNSIIDSPPESTMPLTGGVAVQTYSPDPFSDFRRSMQEMVEARELMDVEGDWEYLHELLMCYLSLNPKHTHKFIVGAFADLLISLMSSETAMESRRTSERRHRTAVS